MCDEGRASVLRRQETLYATQVGARFIRFQFEAQRQGQRSGFSSIRVRGHITRHTRKCGCHARVFHHQELGTAVRHTPGDVLGVVVCIERHNHQPETQGRLVYRYPINAVFQAQGHAVTRHQPRMAKRLLPARRALPYRVRGEVDPLAISVVTIQNSLWCSKMIRQKAGEVVSKLWACGEHTKSLHHRVKIGATPSHP